MADLDQDGSGEEGEAAKPENVEEKKQLRPYRRLVGAIFAVVVIVAAVFILRGIIRHLDRLPTVDTLAKPQVVDVRALRACAEDLERLEARARKEASFVFGVLPDPAHPSTWEATARQLELDRLSIVARCRLNEPSPDAVVSDLETAANELEELLRSYALLYERHVQGGLPHSEQALRALERATSALRAR